MTGVVWGPPDLLSRIEQPGTVFHAQKDTYGGIQGGLSNGEPLTMRVLFKPPATLGTFVQNPAISAVIENESSTLTSLWPRKP